MRALDAATRFLFAQHAFTSEDLPAGRHPLAQGRSRPRLTVHPQGSLQQDPLKLAANETDPIRRAELALSALQIWYNAGTGLWDTTGWWNSANVMTMLSNLAKHDESTQVKDLVTRVFANTIRQAPAKNPQPGVEDQSASSKRSNETEFVLFNGTKPSGYKKSIGDDDLYITTFPPDWNKPGPYIDVSTLPIFQPKPDNDVAATAAADPNQWLDGFYDDDLWWALGWIGAYDITQNVEYLQLAEGIFMAVTKSWPTRCGNGGIFWSWEKDYMNAIANELFLSTAAHLANRAENKEFYVDWAKKELDWFLGSGMINERGTINDGLTEDCKNNGKTTWSYNQGVILGGLVELNKAAPNDTFIPLANKIAKAAIKELSDEKGIIHDKCGPYCGADGSQFKGVFARNLQLLHEAAPDDQYVKTIQANADSIWNNDRDQGNMLSSEWGGPFYAPANASTHSSAMDALVAAITVR